MSTSNEALVRAGIQLIQNASDLVAAELHDSLTSPDPVAGVSRAIGVLKDLVKVLEPAPPSAGEELAG